MFHLDSEARGFTPRTIEFYRQRLGMFLRYCDEQEVVALADLTHILIRSYLAGLQRREVLSSAYIHSHARAIRTFCYFLVREELLKVSPFGKVKMPRLEQKVLSALTGTEVQAALQACEYERDKALLLFMLDTGVRNSELCALNVGDVAEDGAVTVQMGKGQKGRMA